MSNNDESLPGFGYSSDTQQVVQQKCYNVVNIAAGSPANSITLTSAASFENLQEQIGVDVSVGGGYGMFSASATASFLKSMQETDYTMSINYYEMASVIMQGEVYGYGPYEVLNPVGQAVYNNGTNKFFGIDCGDQIITGYNAGAALLMGIKMTFLNSAEKEQFSAKLGVSFADIFSVTTAIKEAATNTQEDATVAITAFQIGGQPQYLSEIFTSNNSGSYFATACSIFNMTSCLDAANGLLGYANSNFSTQFSFSPQQNIYPIGTPIYTDASQYGVNLPASLVTPEVASARKNISTMLLENQYYDQKFTELSKSYPVTSIGPNVTTTFSDGFMANFTNLWSVVKNNLEVLADINPQTSAIGCYNTPQNCLSIVDNIQSNIQEITSEDLSIFTPLQYYYSTALDSCGGSNPSATTEFYYIGDDQWGYINDPNLTDKVQRVIQFNINGVNSTIQLVTNSGSFDQWQLSNAEVLDNGDLAFHEVQTGCWDACRPTVFNKYEFPVQIEPYQPDLI